MLCQRIFKKCFASQIKYIATRYYPEDPEDPEEQVLILLIGLRSNKNKLSGGKILTIESKDISTSELAYYLKNFLFIPRKQTY